jgi:hypothetical protein
LGGAGASEELDTLLKRREAYPDIQEFCAVVAATHHHS